MLIRQLVLAVFVAFAAAGERQQAKPAAPRVVVVAELFTSEGCSSCPPADDLLRRLVEQQPLAGIEVIGLSEHVDYWDRLGWRDPFSSATFTRRQEDYSRIFGDDRIYTPQMVVGGREEMVGSESGKIQASIAAAAKRPMAAVSLDAAVAAGGGGTASVRIDVRDIPLPASSRDELEVIVAVIENGLESHVKAGENARRTLKHAAVTRSLVTAGRLDKGATAGSFAPAVSISPGWNMQNLRVVAFLQDRTSREIHGAAITALTQR